MRELIPIMDMVQLLPDAVGIPAGDVNMRVSVYEDSLGALVLAETLPPQFTPRSKYYATKTIWFCEEIHKQEPSFWRLILLSSLGISSPRAFLSPRLNTFDPKLLVGNYAFLFRSCICPVESNTTSRGSVNIGSLDLVILGVHHIAVSVFSCALGKELCLLYFNTMTVRAAYMSLALARMCGEWRRMDAYSYACAYGTVW